jgi:acyl carrier protein
MSNESLKDQIRAFILDAAQAKGVNEVKDTDSLTDGGIVDSLGIFRLVGFLEENLGVHVGDEEIIQDNFQTINDIERFVMAKLAEQGETAVRQ